MYFRYDSC